MGLPITINLNATSLPDIGVWFANSAAFVNYLNSLNGTAEISPAANDIYHPAVYNESLQYAAINIDGTDYMLVTVEMFVSLKDKLNTLDISYQNLRTELKAAGIIEQAQS